MENISQQTWFKLLENNDNATIIDVRTPDEWKQGIIGNAQTANIFDEIEFIAFLDALDRDKEYFMYCRSGARSGNACQMMDQMGFKTTYNLVGGILNWTGEVHPYQ